MTESYQGSCLCKAVRFEIDEFLPQASHCHCSMCRKFHGAAYATFVGVTHSSFRWVEGEEVLRAYTATNGTTRTFCGHCGSSLTFSSPKALQNVIEIALGAIDDDVPVNPSAHIFVDSAANWTALDDDLPQFREGRDSARVQKEPQNQV